jgi:hypothetical protein
VIRPPRSPTQGSHCAKHKIKAYLVLGERYWILYDYCEGDSGARSCLWRRQLDELGSMFIEVVIQKIPFHYNEKSCLALFFFHLGTLFQPVPDSIHLLSAVAFISCFAFFDTILTLFSDVAWLYSVVF